MEWLHSISYLFGGAFLINAVPHLVSGVIGRPFQTPFASPPGEGLSTSTVNVLWAHLNLAIAYLLLCRVGHFHLRSTLHILLLAAGMLLMSLQAARHFGGFHGGNAPEHP